MDQLISDWRTCFPTELSAAGAKRGVRSVPTIPKPSTGASNDDNDDVDNDDEDDDGVLAWPHRVSNHSAVSRHRDCSNIYSNAYLLLQYYSKYSSWSITPMYIENSK